MLSFPSGRPGTSCLRCGTMTATGGEKLTALKRITAGSRLGLPRQKVGAEYESRGPGLGGSAHPTAAKIFADLGDRTGGANQAIDGPQSH